MTGFIGLLRAEGARKSNSASITPSRPIHVRCIGVHRRSSAVSFLLRP
jgi:hypothetical protein